MSKHQYLAYHNPETGEPIPSPLTDETALLLIPEMGGHGIYNILRKQGAPIEDALLVVWHMQIGEREEASGILEQYGLARLEA